MVLLGCMLLLLQRSVRKKSKHCVFIDDEASVDGGSNSNLPTPQSATELTLLPIENELQIPVRQVEEGMDGEKANDLSKHNRVFGSNVPLGLMNDVMKQYYLKRETEPPMVPLCRVISTDAVRLAIGDASWLVPLFDRAGYVPTMGSFTVSLKGRHGETKNVTQEMVERWDPIWQRLNASFESKLVGEWTDLQHKAFFVWDGNHQLKTWMKHIEEVYSENEQYHPLSKWEHFLSEENNKARGMGLSVDEYKQKLDDAIKRMEEKLRDNGYKYLSIANPLHGEEFFSMLFKKDWSDKSMIGITKVKLYILCLAKITIERCKELLQTMVLTKANDPKATHFVDYKKLGFYMRQEAYWQDFLKKNREKATTSTLKSISKDFLQESTSRKKKKLPKKKVDFHTLVPDDNDEEESLPSPSQRDMQESKSRGASKSIMSDIETWFQRVGSCYEKEYHLKGEVSEYVARLIFADFPASMLVFGIQDSYAADDVEDDIPVWNQFSTCLVRGVMDIADVHLADEGFL
ncbi:hypothetical protein L7F22_037433 [Adiantum nelumboides]|nr:hypothetical protein [Adiantum nelumboides]